MKLATDLCRLLFPPGEAPPMREASNARQAAKAASFGVPYPMSFPSVGYDLRSISQITSIDPDYWRTRYGYTVGRSQTPRRAVQVPPIQNISPQNAMSRTLTNGAITPEQIRVYADYARIGALTPDDVRRSLFIDDPHNDDDDDDDDDDE